MTYIKSDSTLAISKFIARVANYILCLLAVIFIILLEQIIVYVFKFYADFGFLLCVIFILYIMFAN